MNLYLSGVDNNLKIKTRSVNLIMPPSDKFSEIMSGETGLALEHKLQTTYKPKIPVEVEKYLSWYNPSHPYPPGVGDIDLTIQYFMISNLLSEIDDCGLTPRLYIST